MPVDLTKESFDAVEDVQIFTLQPSQLAVVIASYDKTIGRIHILVFYLQCFIHGLKSYSHTIQYKNGHILGFHLQTLKFALPCTA